MFILQSVLGAFFHDIGHLVGNAMKQDRMVTDGCILGVHGHDVIGEQYLKKLGVPEAVTDLPKGHVNAKRFLTYKVPTYYESKCPIVC